MAKNEIAKLRSLFERLELREHDVEKSVSGGSPLSSAFRVDAEDFLHAAEDAFELKNYSSALTDAKRAIHCQIDEVLASLGYSWKRTPLKKKLEIIRKCGFAAPRVIHRVNAARNLLEHEYVNPSASKTEEALDIATLFVNATKRHLESFMGDFYVGRSSERVDTFHFSRELVFAFDEETKAFRITALEHVRPELEGRFGSVLGKTKVGATSELFPTLIKLTVAGDRNEKIIIALHELFDLFRRKSLIR